MGPEFDTETGRSWVSSATHITLAWASFRKRPEARTDAQVEMRTTPQNDFFLVFYTSSQAAYGIAREFTETSGHQYKDAGDTYIDVIQTDSFLIEP